MKTGMRASVLLQVLCCLATLSPWHTLAYLNCTVETGGGICPDRNTCCRMSDGSSGCVASDLGEYAATCCEDGVTGCGVGYSCRKAKDDCVELNSTSLFDPLVQRLPRYRLCRAHNNIEKMWGLQVDMHSQVAYYSSHGPIENVSSAIDMVVLVIHGAGRNADDYFCSMSAAVTLQRDRSNVMVVAPRFFAESDFRDSPSFMFWEDLSDGPWRYGADSRGPTQISSYTALDKLVEAVRTRLPGLGRLVIAGHSSGGQMTQRWTLLTSSWFPDQMKAVVANPSSYIYLSPLRFYQGEWVIAPTMDCPQYDEWEWGLEIGGSLDVSYKQQHLTNASLAIDRYGTRKVDYLIGSLDQCDVAIPGWCNSHGLETSCMDEFQGSNRLQRNAHYMESLRRIGIWENHRQRVVDGVGHDHALMFQSTEGLEALFNVQDDEGSFFRTVPRD
jgi:pimeloyl-ACP methyl ester carboxylesterase